VAGRTTELEAAAAEALRRAGGALPVERLGASLAPRADGREPLARCLRSRSDLFLLIEPLPGPWQEEAWTPAERAEYEKRTDAARASPHVVLVDRSAGAAGAGAPALLRETLLSIWGEAPEDDQIRRELGRAVRE
jgi:hypothetical protein